MTVAVFFKYECCSFFYSRKRIAVLFVPIFVFVYDNNTVASSTYVGLPVGHTAVATAMCWRTQHPLDFAAALPTYISRVQVTLNG